MHFIFSCPKYEDLGERSIGGIGKAENIIEDTALLHLLMISKCIVIMLLQGWSFYLSYMLFFIFVSCFYRGV